MITTKDKAVKLLNDIDYTISLYNGFATKKKLPTLSYTNVVETKYLVDKTTKEDYVHTKAGNVCVKEFKSLSGEKEEVLYTEEQYEALKVAVVEVSSENCEMREIISEAEWALEKALALLKKAKKAAICIRILAIISLLISAGTVILSYYS